MVEIGGNSGAVRSLARTPLGYLLRPCGRKQKKNVFVSDSFTDSNRQKRWVRILYHSLKFSVGTLRPPPSGSRHLRPRHSFRHASAFGGGATAFHLWRCLQRLLLRIPSRVMCPIGRFLPRRSELWPPRGALRLLIFGGGSGGAQFTSMSLPGVVCFGRVVELPAFAFGSNRQ